MVKREYCMTRLDGVNLYRRYSDTTPYLKQLPTGIIYDCWVYKVDENGNETKEVDWDKCGVIDVENAPYTYIEIKEDVKNEEAQ